MEVPTEPGYALPCIEVLHEARTSRFSPSTRVQQRLVPGLLSRTLAFQFCVVGGRGVEVFKVLVQDRDQQH